MTNQRMKLRRLVVFVVCMMVVMVPGRAIAASRFFPQLRGAVIHTFLGETVAVNAREFGELKTMHADVTRVDLPLPLLAPHAAGQFNQAAVARIDTALRQAANNGIKVILTVNGMPCWMSSAPSSVRGDCDRSNVLSVDTSYSLYAPDNYSDWAGLMRFIARRWGNQLWAIEIGNEPNNPNFFGGTPAEYARMLRAAYPAIKRVRPQLLVVAGALASADATYLDTLYRDGIHGYFDAFSVHPYDIRLAPGPTPIRWLSPQQSAQTPPSSDSLLTGVPAIRRIMVAHHDASKPIVISEYGYPVCPPGSVPPICVTPAQQASWLTDAVRTVATWPYVAALLVYQLRGIENTPVGAANSPLGDFGLLADTFAPRPSYFALGQLFGSLPRP